jgi:hypothetical protein
VSDHSKKPATPGDILEHHGVKGQKWGVQKKEDAVGRDTSGRLIPAPPKDPLSDRNQRRVEKFQKKSDVMNTRISELKLSNQALQGTRNPAKLYAQYANNQNIKTLDRTQKRAVRDSEAVQKGKLTSTQKKVIVGAVGVSAIIAVGVVYKGQQSGALNSTALRGAAFLRGEKVPFNVNSKLSGHMSASELLTNVAKPVNPGYSKAGGKMNCRRSTYAYELRRRGFDVHATTSSVGWGQSESGVINALTPGSRNFYRSRSLSTAVVETGTSSVARGDRRNRSIAKILVDGLANKDMMRSSTLSSSQKVLEELAKQPNGARGEVMFKFPTFGHSMAYEIVDGTPHIFDSQKGTLYNSATKMVETKWDGFHGAEITRLDNADLDLNFLSRWATNVGGK